MIYGMKVLLKTMTIIGEKNQNVILKKIKIIHLAQLIDLNNSLY